MEGNIKTEMVNYLMHLGEFGTKQILIIMADTTVLTELFFLMMA